jgi:hypothetical protein
MAKRNSNNNSGRPLCIYGIWKKDPENHDEKGFWTQIGRAFQNSDGSFNLLFDYIPTDKNTRIHVRERQERKDNKGVDATEGFSDE